MGGIIIKNIVKILSGESISDILTLKFLFLLPLIFSQNLHGFEVIDITRFDFNGSSFGKRSYGYIGSEDIEVVSSPDFQEKFVIGKFEQHIFPPTNDTFWVKINFFNPLPLNKKIYIHDTLNYSEEVSVFHESKLLGRLLHQDNLRNRMIEVIIPSNTTMTLFIKRLCYGGQRQSWTYWLDQNLLVEEISESTSNWQTMMGIFAMSFIFNLLLFFAYRSKIYIFYLAYLVAIVLYATSTWSIFGSPYIHQIVLIMTMLTNSIAILFSIEFLDLRKIFPKGRIVLLQIAAAWCIVPILSVIDPLLAFRIATILGGLMSVTCFSVAIYVYVRTKDFHTLIYIVAYGSFLLGIGVQILIWRGLVPSMLGYNHIIFYSAAIENILMLVAMGYKIYSTQKELVVVLKNLSKEKSKLLQAEKLNSEIRIRSLYAQMRPHFLFNSLNSIICLIDESNEEACDAIQKLSDVYRHILLGTKSYTWPLKEELNLIKSYLKIQQLRFKNRLTYTIVYENVDLELMHCPCLSIHAIVENSINHGISPNPDGGTISIKLEPKHFGVMIIVRDSGSGIIDQNLKHKFKDKDGTGTGLVNTKMRLENMYGKKSNFRMEISEDGTEVQFWISGEGS